MQIWELFLIAVSLSADAFAIATCKGLCLKKITPFHMIVVGLYFGIAQAVMPIIGYFLASTVAAKIADYSFYIAFALLLLIGANMITECKTDVNPISPKEMIPIAIATSIDALAVGVTFALEDVEIFSSAALIGITTFVLSAIGVGIGSFIGGKFRKISSIVGGSVLILMGAKILLEGLGVI